jgi:hypothetical protein
MLGNSHLLGSYFKPDLILQVSLPRFHIGQSVVVHPHLSHNWFPMDDARVRAGSYNSSTTCTIFHMEPI